MESFLAKHFRKLTSDTQNLKKSLSSFDLILL